MRMQKTALPLAVAVALAATCARAGDAAAGRIERRISVNFVDTPLVRAVQEIGRLANVAVVVEGLGKEALRHPVSLELERTRAREVLDLVAKDAKVGYGLDGHVVLVSTLARARAKDLVIRTYEVRDLVYEVLDFPGPAFTSETMPERGLAMGPISIEEITPEMLVEEGSLADMIVHRIRPEDWGTDLGTSVEERGGRLIVVHTEEVHLEIRRLLDELRATEGVFMRIDARAFLVGAAALEEALAGTAVPGFLGPDERSRVMKRLADAGAARVGSARTVCMNNQRTHVYSGIISHYVSDLDVSADAYDPVVSDAFGGFAVDFRAIASHDRKYVTLRISFEAPEADGEPRTRTVMTGSGRTIPQPGGEQTVTLEKDEETVTATIDGADETVRILPARLQAPDQATRHVFTNVHVPVGTTAYFSVPAGRGGGTEGVVLFMLRLELVGRAMSAGAVPAGGR